ncbi:MAG: hemolysin family protein [Rhodothermales bacterium]
MMSAETLLAGALVMVLLLVLSALFSGSEVALFTLDSTQREALANSDDPAAKRVGKLLETPRSILITILVLNTFVNVGAAILAAILTHSVAVANDWSPVLTVILEVLVLTFVLLVVSEITPKLIANRRPVQFAKRMSGVLLVLHRLLYPLSTLLSRTTQSLQKQFRHTSARVSAQDLKTMAEIGEAHGHIELEERELIHSIVEFGDTSVREIMVSRLDIVALHAGATLEEAIKLIRQNGRSRLPLYVEHLDNIMGMVYAKDVLRHITEKPDSDHVDWTRMARPAIFVPMYKKLDDLLSDFQARKTHIAIVVDEYGGTAGLVTLEDVLEEIVGDIRDEHDESEPAMYEQLTDREFLFDARIDLDELNDVTDLDIDTEEYDFETLGGLIFHLAGEIPDAGDAFDHDGMRLVVEEVDNNRVVSVRVTLPETEPPPGH